MAFFVRPLIEGLFLIGDLSMLQSLLVKWNIKKICNMFHLT